MKAAPCSWWVVTKVIGLSSSASMMSIFSSPGTPKMYSTPSFSRHFTNSCASVIATLSHLWDTLKLLRFYLESNSMLDTASLPVTLRRCDACHLPSSGVEIVCGLGKGTQATFLWQTNAHRQRRAFALVHR